MNAAPSRTKKSYDPAPGWRLFIQAIFLVYLIMGAALLALKKRQ